MNYKIINSGSDGNCIMVNDFLALDVGVSWKKLAPYAKNLKLVFISHVHQDHFKKNTVKKLAKEKPTLRFAVGEYLVSELLKLGVNAKNIDIVKYGKKYNYGQLKISPIKLYHDVPNMGLRVYINEKKLFFATDTKTLEGITAKDYDIYLVEGNYEDEEELKKRAENNYYYERVKRTHLSRVEATEWLLENMGQNSRYEFIHKHKER